MPTQGKVGNKHEGFKGTNYTCLYCRKSVYWRHEKCDACQKSRPSEILFSAEEITWEIQRSLNAINSKLFVVTNPKALETLLLKLMEVTSPDPSCHVQNDATETQNVTDDDNSSVALNPDLIECTKKTVENIERVDIASKNPFLLERDTETYSEMQNVGNAQNEETKGSTTKVPRMARETADFLKPGILNTSKIDLSQKFWQCADCPHKENPRDARECIVCQSTRSIRQTRAVYDLKPVTLGWTDYPPEFVSPKAVKFLKGNGILTPKITNFGKMIYSGLKKKTRFGAETYLFDNIEHMTATYVKAHLKDLTYDIVKSIVPPFYKLKHRAGKDRKAMVFVNYGKGQSSTHFDKDSSILFVIDGMKEVMITPPFSNTEEESLNSTIYQDIDPFDNEIGSSSARKRKWIRFDLHPGEALFIPQYWVHAIRSKQNTIGVSMQIEPAMKNDTPESSGGILPFAPKFLCNSSTREKKLPITYIDVDSKSIQSNHASVHKKNQRSLSGTRDPQHIYIPKTTVAMEAENEEQCFLSQKHLIKEEIKSSHSEQNTNLRQITKTTSSKSALFPPNDRRRPSSLHQTILSIPSTPMEGNFDFDSLCASSTISSSSLSPFTHPIVDGTGQEYSNSKLASKANIADIDRKQSFCAKIEIASKKIFKPSIIKSGTIEGREKKQKGKTCIDHDSLRVSSTTSSSSSSPSSHQIVNGTGQEYSNFKLTAKGNITDVNKKGSFCAKIEITSKKNFKPSIVKSGTIEGTEKKQNRKICVEPKTETSKRNKNNHKESKTSTTNILKSKRMTDFKPTSVSEKKKKRKLAVIEEKKLVSSIKVEEDMEAFSSHWQKWKSEGKKQTKRRRLTCGICEKGGFVASGGEMWFLSWDPNESKNANCSPPEFTVPTFHPLHLICLKCCQRPMKNRKLKSKTFGIKEGEFPEVRKFEYRIGSKVDYDFAVNGCCGMYGQAGADRPLK